MGSSNYGRTSGGGAELSHGLHSELMRLKAMRDSARTLREMSECCVAIEDALGGRPPTRAFDSYVPRPEQR